MKALVKKQATPGIWLEDVPEPGIGINDVLIRVDRTAMSDPLFRVAEERNVVVAAQVAKQEGALPIHHQAEGSLGGGLQQQDHGMPEVRVQELRDRHEQAGGQRVLHSTQISFVSSTNRA